MKKGFSHVLSVLFVFALILVNAPKNVEAVRPDTDSSVAGGTWNVGTEVSMVDLIKYPAAPWLQLLTDGVKLSAPARICHPFRGGQFHWVGQIMQLIDGKWVKLVTTNEWVPSTEGTFTSCAQAPAAGIYALFGYYNGPIIAANPIECSNTFTPSMPVGGSSRYMTVTVSPFVSGTPISYQILTLGTGYSETGSGTLDGTGTYQFMTTYAGAAIITFTVRFTMGSCYKDVIYSGAD
jgi:hypothetical protein